MNIYRYPGNMDIIKFVAASSGRNYIVLTPINVTVSNYLHNRSSFESEEFAIRNYGFEEYVERFGSLILTTLPNSKFIFCIQCYTDKEFSYISLLMGLVKLNKALQYVETTSDSFNIIGPNISVDYKELCDIIESEMDESADLTMLVKNPNGNNIMEEGNAREFRGDLSTIDTERLSLETGFTFSGSTTTANSVLTGSSITLSTTANQSVEAFVLEAFESLEEDEEEEDERDLTGEYLPLDEDPVYLSDQD